ncbi:efflux RND transporter periplasmic adaptor subunit [Chitinophaga sp. GCM10012297]|uniref:HlyD family efflux transporter periplasmic adaptor subunit n=1 Tax=Chitinophaga chungangae TaxID=2821488 RepID=A0ABS3YH70_9BACT|nr:HlyD family efflux transporter periplasmic adaptor subunit [Chitinophaga chungangae]MBO9154048.1 HlyD family efflux transporter periplasmic adaptor subunit [Chitinophaga chungangae]
MDKELPAAYVAQRKRKRLLLLLIAACVLIAGALLLRAFLHPSIQRSAVTTAVVETGRIENTLNASGEILPEFEAVITSPVSASVQEVLADAGSAVEAGQSLLRLDKSGIEGEYEKGKFQLESKQNELRKLKLALDKSYFDLQSSNEIKQLRINALQADVENSKRLFKAGGGTRENIEQAEMNLKVAQLEKTQLENEIRNKQQSMKLEMRESEITAAIQAQEVKELKRKLDQASVTASRGGVVTWINKNIGTVVREGEALARIADLGSFKATGTIADSYLSQLSKGMPVVIRINGEEIRGSIQTVYPAVQNSAVTFDIRLEEPHHAALRPNLKVDVYLVTATGNNIMRIKNGPAFKGPSGQGVFVVQGNKAVRRTVHTGMSNFDYVELKDNVRPGDVIITSDMSRFRNAREIMLK